MKKLKIVLSSDISISIFPGISISLVKTLTVRLNLRSWLALVKAYIYSAL